MDFQEAEEVDGVRLGFNVWPTTRLEQVKLILPLGVMYTPLIRADEVKRCQYKPIACRSERCGGILSPWADCDESQGTWTCPICGTPNAFPSQYNKSNVIREELDDSATTIEYEPQQEGSGSPAFLFVIDTAIDEEELNSIKASIQQAISLLPTDAMIGLITFGKHVSVHEIGFTECQKTVVVRGDVKREKWKDMTVEKMKLLLEVTQSDNESILRFLQPLESIENSFMDLLESLQPDQWTPKHGCRRDRCTGVAALVGTALLEAAFQGYPARMIMFSGGPPVIGPGMIVEKPLSDHIRAHRDIHKNKAPFYEIGCKFYSDLASHAAENGHVIDMFACCLDQTGVAEQRVLMDHTGGVFVLSDTFKSNVFSQSFASLFMTNSEEGELSMCFNTETKILCSRQICVSGCIGPVTRMRDETSNTKKVNKSSKSNMVSSNEVGIGGTNKWSIGGIYPNTTLAFIFDISSNQRSSNDESIVNQTGYIQFITTYKTSYGTNVTRVTTIGIKFANPNKAEGLKLIKEGFDQECAAGIVARLAIHKSDTEFQPDLMRWLDHLLIKLVTKFANYQKGDTDSFKLSDEFINFPQFMFYLRRSQFIQVFNYSPDETAFFKATMLRENVSNSLTMIQPLLHSFSSEVEEYWTPMPVLLELSSRNVKSILLLDTFFHLVVWYGRDVAQWRDDGMQNEKEYEWFNEMLEAPKEECKYRSSQRFPYPNVIFCDEGSGQERFLIAKLNPDNTEAEKIRPLEDQVTGDTWTDDVSLKVFMQHLKKLAVNPP